MRTQKAPEITRGIGCYDQPKTQLFWFNWSSIHQSALINELRRRTSVTSHCSSIHVVCWIKAVDVVLSRSHLFLREHGQLGCAPHSRLAVARRDCVCICPGRLGHSLDRDWYLPQLGLPAKGQGRSRLVGGLAPRSPASGQGQLEQVYSYVLCVRVSVHLVSLSSLWSSSLSTAKFDNVLRFRVVYHRRGRPPGRVRLHGQEEQCESAHHSRRRECLNTPRFSAGRGMTA